MERLSRGLTLFNPRGLTLFPFEACAAHEESMTNKNPEEIAKLNAYRTEGGLFGTRPRTESPVTIEKLDDAPTYGLGDEVLILSADGRKMVKVTVTEMGEAVRFTDEYGDDGDLPAAQVFDPVRAAEAITEKLTAENRKFTLTFVDYDSELTPQQTVDYLSGDMEAFDQIHDSWSDNRAEGAYQAVNDLLEEYGLDRNDACVDWDILHEHVLENDDSSLEGDLIRNTRAQLMRTRLGHVYGEGTYSGHDDSVWPAREARIAEMLAAHGLKVETDEQREAINELVHNGPYDWHDGVRLEVIFQGDIRDATVWNKDAGDVQDRRLTFESPNILLIDTVNGSGHDVKLPGSLTATVTPDSPAILDKEPDAGYGWDDIAGVVHSAYRTDVKTEWVPAPDKEDQAA